MDPRVRTISPSAPSAIRQAAAQLVTSGHVYRDYSTDAERAADKAAAERDKRAYRFRRKDLSEQTAAQYRGRKSARSRCGFMFQRGRKLVLHDLIKGDVEFATDEIGDFVIVRPDGSPLYNFASVVDDVDMEITHVVRADEHLSNTFPQLLVFEALGGKLPQFAHIPFVAEPGSKAKMSKRKIAEYEKQWHSGLSSSVHRAGLSSRRAGELPGAAGMELRRVAGGVFPAGADREIHARESDQLACRPRPGQAVLARGGVDEDSAARGQGGRSGSVSEERRDWSTSLSRPGTGSGSKR